MPTKLTTPVVRSTATDIAIDLVALELARSPDLTLTNESLLRVEYSLRDASGAKLETKSVTIAPADIPSGLRTILRNMLNGVAQTLRARSLIPDGTDANDL
jgi:hypothetical protein